MIRQNLPIARSNKEEMMFGLQTLIKEAARICFIFSEKPPIDSTKQIGNQLIKDIHTLHERIMETRENEEGFNKIELEAIQKGGIEAMEMIQQNKENLAKENIEEFQRVQNQLIEGKKKLNILDQSIKDNSKSKACWNTLTDNLKRKCFENMDFKTRYDMRDTCKTERALIDSETFSMDIFDIRCSNNILCLNVMPRGLPPTPIKCSVSSYQKWIPLMKHLLKTGSFNFVSIDLPPEISITEEFNNIPLSIKNLEVKTTNWNLLFFCLKSLKNNVETIKIDAGQEKLFPLLKILSFPRIVNVRFLQLTQLIQTENAYKIAQIYIDEDAEIGRTFQVLACRRGTFEKFATKFGHRIVSKSSDKIRIRTENPTKHIVLELGFEKRDIINDDHMVLLQFMRLLVIPSKMKASECESLNTRWMCYFQTDHHFM